MKKKGFTLVELLAVIVILVVISLIATPMIMNVIEKSKKASLKESANGLVEEAGYYYMQYGVVDNVRFDIEENQINNIDGNTLQFKGYVNDATILINTKGEVALCINDGEYSVYKNYRDKNLIEIDNKNCNIPTGQAVVYLENESTIKEYTNQELTELVTNLQQEIEKLKNDKDSTPTGTVISYMASNSAPEGYLSCDGTVYNINDYPDLANAIKDGLGSYNYYGGDGVTTFAVPDLRGEFLRGTGTATRDTGSGAEVGVHQDGTVEPYIIGNLKSNLLGFRYDSVETDFVVTTNVDKQIENVNGATSKYKMTSISNGSSTGTSSNYTSRPTNTSVLYCIKY